MDSPADILRRHGLQAKKSWGQCFLTEPRIVERIADAARIGATDTVVEIGAGCGTLTAALCRRAARVVAIERDRDLAGVLREELGAQPNLEIAEANALTFELAAVGRDLVVVGNLPYNISSPLLFRLLEQRACQRSATIMVQREVADRLLAAPGTKAYGVPTVLSQQVAELRRCFNVSRQAFTPRPQVDSAVVQLVFRATPRVEADPRRLRQVVRAAFQARRKTLRKALQSAFARDDVLRALEAAGIDSSRRGETLTVEEFGRLARALPVTGDGSS